MASTKKFDYVQSCNAKGGQKCNHFHRDVVNASICAAREHTTHLVNFDENDKMLGKPYARMATMAALEARRDRLGADSTDSRWDNKVAKAKKSASAKANSTKKAASKKAAAKKSPAKKAASAKPATTKKAAPKAA